MRPLQAAGGDLTAAHHDRPLFLGGGGLLRPHVERLSHLPPREELRLHRGRDLRLRGPAASLEVDPHRLPLGVHVLALQNDIAP